MKPILGTVDGKPLAVDVDRLLETRLLIQGSSGSGKSGAARQLVEQVHERLPCLVFDVEGEYATLREKFPFVVAGPGGDIAPHAGMIGLFVRKMVEGRLSAVIDFHELKVPERKQFLRLALESLMEMPDHSRHDALVLIEEAQLFAPQSGGAADAAPALIDLAARGRKKGLCLVAVTQRISDLEKSVVAQCGNRLIGLTTLDADVKRAAYELGFTKKAQGRGLSELKRRQFYAYGPALSQAVVMLEVGETATRPPSRHASRPKTPPSTPAQLREVLAQLSDLPRAAESEAKTVAELQADNRRLKRELAAKPVPPAPATPRDVVREVPVVAPALVKRLEAAVAARQKAGEKVDEADARCSTIEAEISTALRKITTPAPRLVALPPARPVTAAPARVSAPAEPQVAGEVTAPQQRILNALRWAEVAGMDDLDRPRLGFFAKASPKSSAFQNNCGAMRTTGRIEYLPSGTVRLTGAGRAIAVEPEPPGTTDELQAMIFAGLTEPQRRILRALIAAFPGELSREDLAEKAEASATSSAFQNNLGFLRGLGMVEYRREGVAATGRLFVGGARG